MTQKGSKTGYVRVTFTAEDKQVYDDALAIMKDNGIKSLASFGRMAIVSYVKNIKTGKQKIVQ